MRRLSPPLPRRGTVSCQPVACPLHLVPSRGPLALSGPPPRSSHEGRTMIPTSTANDRDTLADRGDRGDDRPRYFLDAAYDTNPEDGDWWLDVGPVTLPGNF